MPIQNEIRKPKLALVTFHRVPNYGAIFQTILTIIYLSERFDVELINYQPDFISNQNSLIRKRKIKIQNFFKIIFDLFFVYKKKNFLANVDSFYKSNFFISKKFECYKNLNIYLKDFEYIVIGGDQVFNSSLSENVPDNIFFPKFSHPKIYSFSSSQGKYHDKKFTKSQIGKLQKFKLLNVREYLNIQNINQNLVCDPLFLFIVFKNRLKIFDNNSKKFDSDFSLIYMNEFSFDLTKKFNNFSRINKVKKFVISPHLHYFYADSFSYCSILDFYHLVKSSCCVFTNTYHGFILSLVLNKTVYLRYNHQDYRFITLFNQLDLFTICTHNNNYLIIKKENYETINKNIECFVNKSLTHFSKI
jgi:hypothetical protein